MRYMLAAISTIALVAASLAQAPAAPAVIVIRAGMLIDGKSGEPRHDQVIIIRGDRIESVSDASSTKPLTGATVIDLSKATVLPGLIESHTHIFLQGEDPAEGGYDADMLKYPASLGAARATVSVRRGLVEGSTTLRDVETERAGYGDVGIKQALAGGSDPGGHGLQTTDAQIAQMVKQRAWHCPTIAVYYTDWAAPDTDAGKRHRLRASVHDETFRKAMQAGVKILFGNDIGGIP